MYKSSLFYLLNIFSVIGDLHICTCSDTVGSEGLQYSLIPQVNASCLNIPQVDMAHLAMSSIRIDSVTCLHLRVSVNIPVVHLETITAHMKHLETLTLDYDIQDDRSCR
ncbi:hypothetical protein QCA50_019774 [Cerrena zonata]|uniref:Uncharacterized protein n=1 Tax=Cerrena zonata TaxID=2478898 RepID=A0AAW0F8Z0_9APHY